MDHRPEAASRQRLASQAERLAISVAPSLRQQGAIAYLHHLVVLVVVLLLDGLVLKPGPDEPELPMAPELPMELVLPLEPPVLPLLVVSLPVVEPLVPAVLPEPLEPMPLLVDGVVGLVLLDELVEPGVPAVPASRLLQALSESAATTARVATAH